jgi:hypothetical protein
MGRQCFDPAEELWFLETQQAQYRFQFVFRQFISVFAKPEHPLALFLDDLQWLDAATLDLDHWLDPKKVMPVKRGTQA